MTNVSALEKRALEEVFIILDERKMSKLNVYKKYLMFYKMMKMFNLDYVVRRMYK